MKKSLRKIKNAIENPNFVEFMVELACKKACFWRYSFWGGGCEKEDTENRQILYDVCWEDFEQGEY